MAYSWRFSYNNLCKRDAFLLYLEELLSTSYSTKVKRNYHGAVVKHRVGINFGEMGSNSFYRSYEILEKEIFSCQDLSNFYTLLVNSDITSINLDKHL